MNRIPPLKISKALANLTGMFKDDMFFLLNKNKLCIGHGFSDKEHVFIHRLETDNLAAHSHLQLVKSLEMFLSKDTGDILFFKNGDQPFVNELSIPEYISDENPSLSMNLVEENSEFERYRTEEAEFLNKVYQHYATMLPFDECPF